MLEDLRFLAFGDNGDEVCARLASYYYHKTGSSFPINILGVRRDATIVTTDDEG